MRDEPHNPFGEDLPGTWRLFGIVAGSAVIAVLFLTGVGALLAILALGVAHAVRGGGL